MLNKTSGLVHFWQLLLLFSLILFLLFSPCHLSVFVIGFARYYVYISTSDSKYNSLLFILDSVTFGESRRPTIVSRARGRTGAWFCSVAVNCSKGTDFQRLAACADMPTRLNCAWQNNPGQLIIWLACGMMLYHRQRREKRTSHTFALPIRFANHEIVIMPVTAYFLSQ